jgi:hypothetical protein
MRGHLNAKDQAEQDDEFIAAKARNGAAIVGMGHHVGLPRTTFQPAGNSHQQLGAAGRSREKSYRIGIRGNYRYWRA